MNNMFNPQLLQLAKDISKENNKSLKELFGDKINRNFLIKIKNEVVIKLGGELFQIFSFKYDNTQIVTGDTDTPEYDICRMITGVHRHHSIFLTKEEIRKKQNDPIYQQQLVDEVIEKVRLHHLSNLYLRKKQIINGDEFLYFPVPYQIFALCTRFCDLLYKHKPIILIYYDDIIKNALSALTLMENNLLSNAYPLCRSMLEQYFKTLILQKHPECVETYSKFCFYEIEQSCCSQKFPDEFLDLYNNRKFKSINNKIDYLHYGWLDDISSYTLKTNRYSIYGILEYLQVNADIETTSMLNHLTHLFKECHGYTHGSSNHVIYPLLQYFEISMMLYYVVRDTFLYMYKELQIEMTPLDKMLLNSLERDFEKLKEQYKMRTTENFKLYYSS